MKVFVIHGNGFIQLLIRAESDDAVGDLFETIEPGKSFLGHPYEFWMHLPDGEHDVEFPHTDAS